MSLLVILTEIVFHEIESIKQCTFAIKVAAVALLYIKQKEYNVRGSVLSFFISTTGKRVFQTGRALSAIDAYYVCSVHYME